MNRIATKTALLGSGSLLGLIGGALMFDRQGFLAGNGVHIARDPSLMSEVTASAGLLLVAAIVMLIGAIKSRHTDLGLVTGSVVYGSYGITRLVSMVTYGMPSPPLIAATLVEIGAASILVLLRLSRGTGYQANIPYAYPGELVI